MILLLTNNSNKSAESHSLLSNSNDYEGAYATSLLSSNDADYGFDGFAGKDIFGTVDFSNMNETFFASAPETAGSVAYSGAETAGSVAYSGAETAGSVACGGSFSAGGDSGCSAGGSFSSVC